MENTECSIVKVYLFIDFKVGVLLYHGVTLWTLWLTFQAKNKVRSAPISIELVQISHQSHNALPQIVTYVVMEKVME